MSNYPNFTLDTIHFFFDIYTLYMVCICCSILLNYFPLYDIPRLCCFLSDQEYIVYIYMRCLLLFSNLLLSKILIYVYQDYISYIYLS